MLKISRIIFCFILVIIVSIGCEGPSGTEGPQGAEGPQGPVGPAGDDGSMMYSGEGDPDGSIGEPGDYYLNQETGALHGPKDGDGWGNPIIVLMGEDGQDGADGDNGEDGADGEDGSQIHSGSGEPDAVLGAAGDFYLNEDEYDLYGPKTSSGWGSPLNLKGADGNANVTRYIFPGANFQSTNPITKYVPGLEDENEMRQNAWLVYLVYERSDGRLEYYSIAGLGNNPDEMYRVSYIWMDNSKSVGVQSYCVTNCSEYSQIEIIKIEAGETVTPNQAKQIIQGLDTSDYNTVSEYYGFYQ